MALFPYSQCLSEIKCVTFLPIPPASCNGPRESASQAVWMWVVDAGFSSLAASLPLLSWDTDLYSPAHLEVGSKQKL